LRNYNIRQPVPVELAQLALLELPVLVFQLVPDMALLELPVLVFQLVPDMALLELLAHLDLLLALLVVLVDFDRPLKYHLLYLKFYLDLS
jgi:hypothetical protein